MDQIKNTDAPLLSISVVSHGQSALVGKLLDDLDKIYSGNFEVIITSNIDEDLGPYRNRPYPFTLINNSSPKGFGANHNSAFLQSSGKYFAIVNPDVRIVAMSFLDLLADFDIENVGAIAPAILSPDGKIEDSARRFPTLWRLLGRVILGRKKPDYTWSKASISVDWVAGMFVVFRPDAFRQVHGFDDKRFFMYLEDVDICERMRKWGWSTRWVPSVSVIHDARRASRKNLKHLKWHVTSALRYLTGL